MSKISNQTITRLFSFTRQTWAKWKEENRQITKLLLLYFSDEEINEFLETGKIRKLELIKDLKVDTLQEKLDNSNVFDIHILKLKLISMPNVAKQLMVDQLNYCIKEKKDYSKNIINRYYKNHFEKAIEQSFRFFNISFWKDPVNSFKSNPDYSKKDRRKFIYYLDNVITEDELTYINFNKKEIINLLEDFQGLLAYSTW